MRAFELALRQVELGARLLELGAGHHDLRGFVFGQRFAVLLVELGDLALPLFAFKGQVLIFELQHHLVGVHQLAGPHRHGTHKAIDRRGDHTLHGPFDPRRRDNAVGGGPRPQHAQPDGGGQRGQAPGRAAFGGRGFKAGTQGCLGAVLQSQHRADEQGRVFGELQGLRVEAVAALEQQRADGLVATDDGQRADRQPAIALRQAGVGQRDVRCGAGRQRVDDGAALIQGLFHRLREAQHRVLAGAQIGHA